MHFSFAFPTPGVLVLATILEAVAAAAVAAVLLLLLTEVDCCCCLTMVELLLLSTLVDILVDYCSLFSYYYRHITYFLLLRTKPHVNALVFWFPFFLSLLRKKPGVVARFTIRFVDLLVPTASASARSGPTHKTSSREVITASARSFLYHALTRQCM